MSQYIENLKSDATINRLEFEGSQYGIRVLGRGENLFFQENEKALVCQIDAVEAKVFKKSIKNWEGKSRMSESERERVLRVIVHCYRKVYNSNVAISE